MTEREENMRVMSEPAKKAKKHIDPCGCYYCDIPFGSGPNEQGSIEWCDRHTMMINAYERLKAENEELLEALNKMVDCFNFGTDFDLRKIEILIAKVEVE